MVTKIICRFGTKSDLDKFNEMNGLDVTQLTKEYDIHTHEKKEKKSAKKTTKESTIESRKWWVKEWWQMPMYESHDVEEPYATVTFKFNESDIELARKVFDQSISEKTKSVWFPKLVPGWYSALRVIGGESKTRYPIYVISKGRAKKCYTSRFLTQMELPHFVVCEPSEYDEYKANVENKYATLLQLDMSYKDTYDTCDDKDASFPKGSGPARNFVWDDSIKRGAKWHWIMDDNATEGFQWFWHNVKVKCRSGALLAACEDWVDRYENLGQFGLNYKMFVTMDSYHPPITMNTRVYSCILNRNDITDKDGKPFRWRCRFNEDTDLSLRILKAGWCTALANWAMFGKSTTMKVKGGNTTSIYVNGTKDKSEMIANLHPDVAKVVWKFHRWHHYVDYSVFKQELKLKPGVTPIPGDNDYGMRVIDTDEVETTDTKTYLENKYKDTPNYVYGTPTKVMVSGVSVDESEECDTDDEPSEGEDTPKVAEEPTKVDVVKSESTEVKPNSVEPTTVESKVIELIIDELDGIDPKTIGKMMFELKARNVIIVHGNSTTDDILVKLCRGLDIPTTTLYNDNGEIKPIYRGKNKLVRCQPNEKPSFKVIEQINFDE